MDVNCKLQLSSVAGSVQYIDTVTGKTTVTYPTTVAAISTKIIYEIIDAYGDAVDLTPYTAWECAFASDYDSDTPPEAAATTVSVVDGKIEAEFSASDLDTVELRSAMEDRSERDFVVDLIGYDATAEAKFIIKHRLKVYSRIALPDSELPENVTVSDYLTAVQTRALVASVDLAQSYYIQNSNLPFSGVEYDSSLGYYKSLTYAGDTLQLIYNVTDCIGLALHLKSANSEFCGDIIVNIYANNTFVETIFIPVEEYYLWQEYSFTTPFSGAISIELSSGLSDDGAAVSTIIDGVRISAAYEAESAGSIENEVSAKPLCYDTTYGYYHRLDDDYGISTTYNVQDIVMVKLLIRSANGNISGDVAIEIANQLFMIAVTNTPTWQTLTLSSPISGVLEITRDTTYAGDTLKDGSDVVTAVVTDINYYSK